MMRKRIIDDDDLVQNQNYKFSEEDIQFIRKLNEKLRQEELRFLALHDQLKLQLTALCRQQTIDDFNYKMNLAVFAKDRKCNARHGVVYGDPIWEDRTWRLFTGEDDRKLLEDNWNFQFTGKDHPLSDVPFCYTMYRIVYSQLLWEDILCIDDVWLELKIDYQFLSNDKEKRRFHKLNKQRIAEGRLM